MKVINLILGILMVALMILNVYLGRDWIAIMAGFTAVLNFVDALVN